MRTVPAILALLVLVCASLAEAARLDTTPDTLIARASRLRDATELPWNPDAGYLGNLRHVQILAPDCLVRVISGPENRVISGHSAVSVNERSTLLDPGRPGKPVPRDVVLTARGPAAGTATGACFTLQLATAHDFLFGGDRLTLLFDRTALPVMRIFLNPSAGLRLWFEDVRIGLLVVGSNADALGGGTGQVSVLTLDGSRRSTSLLFHDMEARRIGVSATTAGARFSIRIGPQTHAGYAQPARAPGVIARHYPIWIDGPVSALEVPFGRVDAMPITDAIRAQARALREAVLRRAGPRPAPPRGPVPDPLEAFGDDNEPPSPQQRVAEVLQRFVPAGVRIGKVDLWKGGAALEGEAPDDRAARTFVTALNRSGEVRNAQIAFIRPGTGGVAWRATVDLLCEAPGGPSRCLSGAGSAYTREQVDAALRPTLGLDPQQASIAFDGEFVRIEGRAAEVDARAAMQRVREGAPWLEGGYQTYGKDRFTARTRMVCMVPPRPDGICAAGPTGR